MVKCWPTFSSSLFRLLALRKVAGLPAISVQGVTWSENAALRHLIVNGRVLQEGQSIGPDHVLERIDRDGSVLRYRGQRYRIGH